MGDPAGIGGEIAAAAWRSLRGETGAPSFFLIGDPDWAAGFGAPVREIGTPAETGEIFAEALPVLPERLAVPARPGSPDPANAQATISSIERAVALARSGAASGVVTCPIAKSVLYKAGFAHPGHTEFLAALTGARRAVMMLTSEAVEPPLRVVPVTIHCALREAIAMLTTDLIVETVSITAADLTRDFGIAKPRIAIAGLNPHAGEGGALGHEDAEIVAPAVAALRARGIDASGPFAADTMFSAPARLRYDAAIGLYHDQALIPIKTLDMEHGVNVTLGLKIIRTSPDHGTAFDIAGKGIASPASLIASIRLAGRMASSREGV